MVIGAGPAGSVAARACARRGARVLLVDKATFPRDKVCGCCLNDRALGVLASEGLDQICTNRGARPLDRFVFAAGGRRAAVCLRGGVALSRRSLDAALVEAAAACGVKVREGVSAAVGSVREGWRVVRLRGALRESEVEARVMIVADGLAGRSLDAEPALRAAVSLRAKIGLGAIVDGLSWVEPGCVHMACGRGGYVGFVRLEDDSVDVAAALDPRWAKSAGGPMAALRSVTNEAGIGDVAALAGAAWRGTPMLTRRRPVAAERLFVVGDAAGYVEPFTGEGMAWALATGAAVGDVAVDTVGGWRHDHVRRWRRRYASIVRRRQLACAAVAWALRRPALVRFAVATIDRCGAVDPTTPDRVARWIGGSRPSVRSLNEEAV